MLKFISFGSGSSGNCYYLFTENDGILIDAGVGIRTLKKWFADFGLSMSNIHNILITHDHADHVKCVGSLSNDLKVPGTMVLASETFRSSFQIPFPILKTFGNLAPVPASP